MMSNSNPAVALAHSFLERGQHADERIDVIILEGVFADADQQTSAIALSQSPSAPFRSVQVYDPAISGDVAAHEDFDSMRAVTITIVKPQANGVAPFVFAFAAATYVESGAPAGLVLCLELEQRAAFLTRGLTVEHWDLNCTLKSPPAPVAVSPRKLVRDYVPGREVTDDLSLWLAVKDPAVTSPIYKAWRQQAARRLLGGLVNVALQEQGQVWLQANGPPLFRIEASDRTLEPGLEELSKAAEWVYLNGHDNDVRHLIFAVELARACRPATPFAEGVRQARESAATTYEAHVQSASRETLKALGDLRKTVIDETQKVTQRAQDLTAGLWRGVAVSASPFVIKVMGNAGTLQNNWIESGLYISVAIFIVFSLALQLRINHIYLRSQRNARTKWLETLYPYISLAERKSIADDPVVAAERSYREARNCIIAVYALLTVLLISFGISTFQFPAQPPMATTSGASATGSPVEPLTAPAPPPSAAIVAPSESPAANGQTAPDALSATPSPGPPTTILTPLPAANLSSKVPQAATDGRSSDSGETP